MYVSNYDWPGWYAFKFSFKRKDKATTLVDVCDVKVSPDQAIDPDLLFQMLF